MVYILCVLLSTAILYTTTTLENRPKPISLGNLGFPIKIGMGRFFGAVLVYKLSRAQRHATNIHHQHAELFLLQEHVCAIRGRFLDPSAVVVYIFGTRMLPRRNVGGLGSPKHTDEVPLC